jgi:dolichol-phosphate mannosyltransferase
MGEEVRREPDNLAIVIPTFNERANIGPLLREFATLQAKWRRPFRIIFVDDSSPDGTGEAARILGERLNLTVTVLNRQPPRSLGAAVVEGIARTEASLVCVMDADLSHPPSLLPAMVDRLEGLEGVVASRYAPGGRIVAWPAHRRVISYVATALTRSILGNAPTDPLSGFFIVRREAIQGVRITGLGNKPLLELLCQTRLLLRDVPYEFRDRQNGTSKLSVDGIVDFIYLLAVAVRRSRCLDASGVEPPNHNPHSLGPGD